MTRYINILLFLFSFSCSFGQTPLIIPQKGIEGIPVIIDSSNISDVFKTFGKEYQVIQNRLTTVFSYSSIGLSFKIDPYDKNEIVRSIIVESPFRAKTKEGIVLNEGMMNDVWNIYGDRTYSGSGNYICNRQNGIYFYANAGFKRKKYDPHQLVNKIEVNKENSIGFPSKVNFVYNGLPDEQKLAALQLIIKRDSFSFDELNNFLETEKRRDGLPYAIGIQEGFSRDLENGLKQDFTKLQIGQNYYSLNIIRSAIGLVYLRFSGDKILEERKGGRENEKILTSQKIRVDSAFDFSNPMNFPSKLYDYGTFCGLHGGPPQKCNEMLELVRQNNYKELSIWLRSMNPEIAAYGYQGLFFLTEKGIELEKSEIEQMNYLKNLTIKLNNCRGCVFGRSETMKTLLSEEELKKNFLSFRSSRYL